MSGSCYVDISAILCSMLSWWKPSVSNYPAITGQVRETAVQALNKRERAEAQTNATLQAVAMLVSTRMVIFLAATMLDESVFNDSLSAG